MNGRTGSSLGSLLRRGRSVVQGGSNSSSIQIHNTSFRLRAPVEDFFRVNRWTVARDEVGGREWEAGDLRLKSNEDLHKLWYVLLKEKNMLLTYYHEKRRLGYKMERGMPLVDPVARSMARVKFVLHERKLALEAAAVEFEKKKANGEI
eukprot:Nk52_evm1s2648 gene=Nk52_evmTU1s2648